MRRRQHLRRIRIQRPIVDIQRKVDGAVEAEDLRVGADGGEREEEDHGEERADDHRAAAAKELDFAEEAGEDGAPDATHVHDGVVAPGDEGRAGPGLRATGGEVFGKEDVV